jgi:hypothetical protein
MQGWSTLLNLPPAHQPTSFPKPSGVFQKLERIKTEVKLEHLIVYIVPRVVHKHMDRHKQTRNRTIAKTSTAKPPKTAAAL